MPCHLASPPAIICQHDTPEHFCFWIEPQRAARQGQSYAIITKELRRGHPAVTLGEVAAGAARFIAFAASRPDLEFQLTPIGCGLAGFTPQQIAPLFREVPPNVLLPPEFAAVLTDFPASQ